MTHASDGGFAVAWRMISALFLLSALALPGAAPAQTMPTETMKVPESQAEINLGFVPVVRQTAPAVVSIYTRKVVEC